MTPHRTIRKAAHLASLSHCSSAAQNDLSHAVIAHKVLLDSINASNLDCFSSMTIECAAESIAEACVHAELRSLDLELASEPNRGRGGLV